MGNAKPIAYSDEIRPQDTERARQTLAVSLFPNETAPWAIDFKGACPRCGDPIEFRRWIVVVAGAVRMNDKQMEAVASQLDALGVDRSHGDEIFDLTCGCGTDHPHSPKDKRGCGARFQVRVTWPD